MMLDDQDFGMRIAILSDVAKLLASQRGDKAITLAAYQPPTYALASATTTSFQLQDCERGMLQQ